MKQVLRTLGALAMAVVFMAAALGQDRPPMPGGGGKAPMDPRKTPPTTFDPGNGKQHPANCQCEYCKRMKKDGGRTEKDKKETHKATAGEKETRRKRCMNECHHRFDHRAKSFPSEAEMMKKYEEKKKEAKDKQENHR